MPSAPWDQIPGLEYTPPCPLAVKKHLASSTPGRSKYGVRSVYRRICIVARWEMKRYTTHDY
ncbi:hypothetical protein SNOG_08689 [Parastagonospora nodorum SN15]|uniref:Uncharacterized protein n=1 Tax=Phaeosphaeria nodorum (strain SN15 / ATCC MYA-4574 / FGSC 10173) TaxID=321614 RepID=Q0UHS5_PHANO|nr:hypothetical protein SNOG_08689 [Parastagonospora nodorum SN15]EAT83857.1 hypothetical protein SNOG_08689 [Parastagonospora nodorum SN15]